MPTKGYAIIDTIVNLAATAGTVGDRAFCEEDEIFYVYRAAGWTAIGQLTPSIYVDDVYEYTGGHGTEFHHFITCDSTIQATRFGVGRSPTFDIDLYKTNSNVGMIMEITGVIKKFYTCIICAQAETAYAEFFVNGSDPLAYFADWALADADVVELRTTGASALGLGTTDYAPVVIGTDGVDRINVSATGAVVCSGTLQASGLSSAAALITGAAISAGTTVSSSTATPITLNLGGTYANSAGDPTKMKLRVYDDTSTRAGLSASLSALEIFGIQSNINFYGNTELLAQIYTNTPHRGFKLIAGESGYAFLELRADEGDDAGDRWRIRSDHTTNSLFFQNDSAVSDTFITKVTLATDGVITCINSIYMKEIAAANADVAAYGQIWVKNDTPNTLWFTDDAGTDHQLGVSGGTDYTWEWMDDFDGMDIDTTIRWNKTGAPSLNNNLNGFGILYFNAFVDVLAIHAPQTAGNHYTFSNMLPTAIFRSRYNTDYTYDEVMIDQGMVDADNVFVTAAHAGACFRYDITESGGGSLGDSGNWIAISSDGAALEETDTGVALNGTMKNFRIEVSAANVKFYIDGVLKATHSVRVPGNSTIVTYAYVDGWDAGGVAWALDYVKMRSSVSRGTE